MPTVETNTFKRHARLSPSRQTDTKLYAVQQRLDPFFWLELCAGRLRLTRDF